MLNKIKLFLITILLIQNTSCEKKIHDPFLFNSYEFSYPFMSVDLNDIPLLLKNGNFSKVEELEKKLVERYLSIEERARLYNVLASKYGTLKKNMLKRLNYIIK